MLFKRKPQVEEVVDINVRMPLVLVSTLHGLVRDYLDEHNKSIISKVLNERIEPNSIKEVADSLYSSVDETKKVEDLMHYLWISMYSGEDIGFTDPYLYLSVTKQEIEFLCELIMKRSEQVKIQLHQLDNEIDDETDEEQFMELIEKERTSTNYKNQLAMARRILEFYI